MRVAKLWEQGKTIAEIAKVLVASMPRALIRATASAYC